VASGGRREAPHTHILTPRPLVPCHVAFQQHPCPRHLLPTWWVVPSWRWGQRGQRVGDSPSRSENHTRGGGRGPVSSAVKGDARTLSPTALRMAPASGVPKEALGKTGPKTLKDQGRVWGARL
jgi:hypothetical protein